jgi:hypothetical protein
VDIINVVSVTSPAEVTQWFEENDEEVQGALYWRQALDVRTNELSVSKNNLFSPAGSGCHEVDRTDADSGAGTVR